MDDHLLSEIDSNILETANPHEQKVANAKVFQKGSKNSFFQGHRPSLPSQRLKPESTINST
jgi:hypothetical protein